MKNTTKRHLKAFSIIGIACAGLVSTSFIAPSAAQTGFAPPSSLPEQPAGPADNQIVNDIDARIAWLKASLQLTASQERNWPDLRSQLHDFEIQQAQNAIAAPTGSEGRDRGQTSETERPNEFLLLRKQADELSGKAASLKKLADAAEPFFGDLDDRQKAELLRYFGPELTFPSR